MTHKPADHAKGKAPSKRQERRLQEVWTHNLEDEIERIRDQVESYPYVAMDTLLPGIVARPTGPFGDYADYNYQTLKSNVDLTRALQISFTLTDETGARPKGIGTWRFNFCFDAAKDLLGQESIADSLGNSLDMPRHAREGIDASMFGELLMSSGLVLNDEVKWVVFCGTCLFTDRAPEDKAPSRGGELASTTFCGLYNFAYLLQFLTSQPLPDDPTGFRESLDLFFPSRCDVAGHIQHLPPGPPLSSRDPADALRRPLYCNAAHLLEAFFRLPEAVRDIAFDPVEEPQAPVVEKKQRRRKDAAGTQNRNGASSAGALLLAGARQQLLAVQ